MVAIYLGPCNDHHDDHTTHTIATSDTALWYHRDTVTNLTVWSRSSDLSDQNLYFMRMTGIRRYLSMKSDVICTTDDHHDVVISTGVMMVVSHGAVVYLCDDQ